MTCRHCGATASKPLTLGGRSYFEGRVIETRLRVREDETQEQLKERMRAEADFFVRHYGIKRWQRGGLRAGSEAK